MRQDFRLTTTEILYYMPDYRSLLQTFIWQFYDVPPEFPRLILFLDYWKHNIHAPIAEVTVCYSGIIRPISLRHIKADFSLN